MAISLIPCAAPLPLNIGIIWVRIPDAADTFRRLSSKFGPDFHRIWLSGNFRRFLLGSCIRFIIQRDIAGRAMVVFSLPHWHSWVPSLADWYGTPQMMVITNMPTILLLGGTAVKCLRDYQKQKAEGKDPHFVAADIELKQDTDFWK